MAPGDDFVWAVAQIFIEFHTCPDVFYRVVVRKCVEVLCRRLDSGSWCPNLSCDAIQSNGKFFGTWACSWQVFWTAQNARCTFITCTQSAADKGPAKKP